MLLVTVESDCTCLFITSVNKRQIANHNTDSIWNEGQQWGVSATYSRVITSFMCIRGAHPWHASYWLSETSTPLSHRRTARVYLELSSLFYRYPVLTLIAIQRCSSGSLEVHLVPTIVISWKKYFPNHFFIYHTTNSFINISLFKDATEISKSTAINILLGVKVIKGNVVPLHATKV